MIYVTPPELGIFVPIKRKKIIGPIKTHYTESEIVVEDGWVCFIACGDPPHFAGRVAVATSLPVTITTEY